MPIIPSTEFPSDSPFVVACTICNSSVIVKYNNDLRLKITPDLSENHEVCGLNRLTLTYHGEKYAAYDPHKESYPQLGPVSKDFLAELVRLAVQGHIYWEYLKHASRDVDYKYNVLQTAWDFAETLDPKVLV